MCLVSNLAQVQLKILSLSTKGVCYGHFCFPALDTQYAITTTVFGGLTLLSLFVSMLISNIKCRLGAPNPHGLDYITSSYQSYKNLSVKQIKAPTRQCNRCQTTKQEGQLQLDLTSLSTYQRTRSNLGSFKLTSRKQENPLTFPNHDCCYETAAWVGKNQTLDGGLNNEFDFYCITKCVGRGTN